MKKHLPTPKKKNEPSLKNYSGKWIWAGLVVVAFLILYIYWDAFSSGLLYNWDDPGYITDNPDINGLSWMNMKLFFTKFYVGNYQPLTMFFYALAHKVSSAGPLTYHLLNITIHILNTILVYIFITGITKNDVKAAFITAAFFAVHPMHVESVAWVSEAKDVFYTLFFLLALIFYSRYLGSSKSKLLVYVLVCFIFSCLCKPAAVVLPLVMLLMDYYHLGKPNLRMIPEKIPFFIVSLIFGLVAIHSQENAISGMAPKMSILNHLSVVSFSLISYLLKAFVPIHLSAIYPYPGDIEKILPWYYYLSFLGLGLLIWFAWYSRRWGRDVLFGMLFFLITIILVLQILPAGAAMMADRYTYVPYIGVFFIVGRVFTISSQNKTPFANRYQWLYVTILFIGLCLFTAGSSARVKVWKNDESLFTDVIEKNPECSIPYENRAYYYLKYYANNVYLADSALRKEYILKAMSDFQNSLNYKTSDYARKKVYYSMGIAQDYLGDFKNAIGSFNLAISLDNQYSDAYNNRGCEFYKIKRYEEALNDFNKVIAFKPEDPQVYLNRGKTKLEMKDFTGARDDFSTAIGIENAFALAYNNRAFAKMGLQDNTGAIADLTRVLDLEPANANAYSVRGYLKHITADYHGALLDYNKALELNPSDISARNNRILVLSLLQKGGK